MTTKADEEMYRAQHVAQSSERNFAVFNPSSLPVESLPMIYGFNNGGSAGWLTAIAISEDGEVLGQHMCSPEAYMVHDLGIIEGAREDRHADSYRKHYPNGYRMDFVEQKHPGLLRAFQLHHSKQEQSK